ncbi:MAG: DUF6048 family protein [Cyclobacteriaceae bacterium]
MLRYIFSLLLLSSSVWAVAQLGSSIQQGLSNAGSNSGGSKPITMKEMRQIRKGEPKDWSIKYVKVSYDLIPPGRMVLKPDQKGQELQASIAFYKYFFMVEGGFQDFTRSKSDYNYNSSGTFFRFGPEINLLKINEHGGAMTFGLRYAQSNFSDKFDFVKATPGYGENTFSYENPDARLIWMELVMGLNLPLSDNFHMGYTIRYKVFRNVDRIDVLKPFDVPGFGRYEKRTAMGFSYYIGWAIPLKKMEEVPAGVQ